MTRTVLVTGASSDIGLSLLREYVSAGWHVIAQYRTERDEFVRVCREAGDRITPVVVDFADGTAVVEALDNRCPTWREASAFVHLAAVYPISRFDREGCQDLPRTMAINVYPAFGIIAELGPLMAARGFGRIVLGSSIGVAFGGGDASFAYSFSKHALEFIPSMARKWAQSNVYYNVARIGVTRTRMFDRPGAKSLADRAALIPARRAAEPAEIARHLYGLGSSENAYITGQVIHISGGE